jgi:uncharacterized membrane protein
MTKTDGMGGLTTGRIEALTDGVFAVVMTLLVLDLKVPVIAGADAALALPGKLLELWPRLLTFILSFVIAGVYWVGHHNQYQFIRRSDRVLLWINILFMLCVAFIPFSTALLGEYPQLPIAVTIYGLNLIVIGAVLYAHWWYATADHRLVDHDIDPHVVRVAKQRILIAPVAYTVAILLSVFGTALSLAIYLVVPVMYIAPGAVDRHWRRRTAAAEVSTR